MGIFRRPGKKRSKMDKLVAGIIIGGAIGSIVGKKLLDNRRGDEDEEDDDIEDEDLEEEGEE